MNKTLSTIGTILAVLALLVGIASYTKTPSQIKGINGSQGPQGERGLVGPQGPAGRDGRNGADAPVKLGAVTSPDFPFSCFSLGGFQRCSFRVRTVFQSSGVASTTVCNIKSPNATSTLTRAWVDIDTGTTSEAHVQLAYSAVPDATSTVIASMSIPANVGMQFTATSTSYANVILAPNSYVVVKSSPTLATASSGTVSDTGSCGADFVPIDY